MSYLFFLNICSIISSVDIHVLITNNFILTHNSSVSCMNRDASSIGVPNTATPDVRVCDVTTHMPVEWIVSYKNRGVFYV